MGTYQCSYPSSYTPSATGSCLFTISKMSEEVCQLRLDFQTFKGFATTTPAGTCSDSLAAVGQTGADPPSICGTNTGYHSTLAGCCSYHSIIS